MYIRFPGILILKPTNNRVSTMTNRFCFCFFAKTFLIFRVLWDGILSFFAFNVTDKTGKEIVLKHNWKYNSHGSNNYHVRYKNPGSATAEINNKDALRKLSFVALFSLDFFENLSHVSAFLLLISKLVVSGPRWLFRGGDAKIHAGRNRETKG